MRVPRPDCFNPFEIELNRLVLNLAAETSLNLYIVGGLLRDCFLASFQGRPVAVKDIDYAVQNGSAFTFARQVASALGGHFVALDQKNDTARVVFTDQEISLDFAGCVGGSIESDIHRRDLTINALAWDPQTPDSVLDLTGGIADIKTKVIRAVTERAFVEDPLRILRAFRFAAMIEAVIEPDTVEWLRRHVSLLSAVAAERVNLELFTTLNFDSADLLVTMGQCRILEAIFPELTETRRVTPNAFHHLGLFDHSLDTVPQLESRLPSVPTWVKENVKQELSACVTRLAATKLACLLHDIGKPKTWVINEEGRHTFYGHDSIGAEMCEAIAQRMKWSRPVERFIVKLVKWHLRPGALFHQGEPTERAVRRFYRSVGDDLPELMLLAFADFAATRGPGLMGENRHLLEDHLNELLAGYRVFIEEDRQRERLLDGRRVMELLAIPPGPIVGEILSALDEAQEFKEVQDRTAAEHFVLAHYREKYCK